MSRESLQRRLRSLRGGEAANLVALPAIFGWLWSRAEAPVNVPLRVGALLVLLYVLLQGSLYWHLKIRAIASRRGLPASFAPVFLWFRRSNGVVLVGGLAATVAAGLRGTATAVDVAWAVGLLGFAAVEHVNYYAYQLAGGLGTLLRRGRLRRAALAVDLASRAP